MNNTLVENNFNFELDLLSLHKMLFIYNAILNGWTVKLLSKNSFEFKKNKSAVKKEIYLDDFLKTFVKNNLNIDHILGG